MRLGYHLSIADGLHKAIDLGEKLNCEAIQIFTKSPKSWNFDIPPQNELDLFKKKWKASNIKDIVAHSIYLINLASPNPYIWTNSINSILSSLQVCDKLGLLGLVTHIGSHKGRGVLDGTKRAVSAISNIFNVYTGNPLLILEISAGAGDLLGRNFVEIKNIINGVKDERIGICIDTAHAFESGYDVKTKDGLDNMLEEVDNYIGLKKLKVLHINDSKTPFASNLDRHENIGSGQIGIEAFSYIVNHPFLKDLPGILETPGLESAVSNKSNLELLRSLENDRKQKKV